MPPAKKGGFAKKGAAQGRSAAAAGKKAQGYSAKKKIQEHAKRNYDKEKSASASRHYVPRLKEPMNAKPKFVSHRVKDVDLHLASQISSQLKVEIAKFKAKQAPAELFDKNLSQMFTLVPPPLVMQHLPPEVASFRSYLPRFEKGAPNLVCAFVQWLEWAFFEASKSKSFGKTTQKDAEDDNEGDGAPEKKSRTQIALAQKVKERSHVTALLNMCVRHNAQRRKEGLHAFINYLKAKLKENEDVDCRTLDGLRATAHHSVPYALSRLVLGMATEDISMTVFYCSTLYAVLTQTSISAAVVLAILDDELALSSRMRAVKARVEARQRQTGAEPADNEIDPDDLNDPTKGERNQRMIAAVFGLSCLVAARVSLSAKEAEQVAASLSFCYVEQKATRVLSANMLFQLWEQHTELLNSNEAMQWATFAFFFYPKVEYFRPEAIQCLLRLMELETKPNVHCFTPSLVALMAADPLQPATMEQLTNALFRREQVTAMHPMVHPVWGDLFNLVMRRCAAGESLKEHLATIVHTAIAPYRRGSADVPRRVLFQKLVERLGQMAVMSTDAEERMEMLHLTDTTMRGARRVAAKATPIAELKQLSVAALDHKLSDLITQYQRTRDDGAASAANRTWALNEIRNCLLVPLHADVECPYINKCVLFFLESGFFPSTRMRDEKSKNKCVYLFADSFSFTFPGDVTRPRCTVEPLEIIRRYLAAEEKEKTRFNTAVRNKKFLKARNRIVEALESASQRSVLFYEKRDMEILLALCFLILSVDDPTNSDATLLASSVVPDLVSFYLHGTLDTLHLFFDVLMSVLMRKASPLQVMPLMTCVRRIAAGYVQRFARHIRTRSTLDLLLAPLKEGFNTDSREIARQRRIKDNQSEGSSEEDDDEAGAAAGANSDDDEGSSSSSSDADNDEGGADSHTDEESAAPTEVSDADDGTEPDDDDASDAAGEEQGEKHVYEEEEEQEGQDGEAESDFEEEEAPTQGYIDALKGMVGNVDLDHSYPVDTENREKSDVVRAITLVSRAGIQLNSPLVVHIFQVLLAVCREEVKTSDDVIFNSSVAGVETLLMSKNRYFGHFVGADELFQLLGDLQSYCRKLLQKLFQKSGATAKALSTARYRFGKLKGLALRVFHYVSMLAYKNHAGEEVRITLAEYYKSIFCDRGWDMKRALPGIKKDIYYYRQGFAWVLLPTIYEKFEEVAAVEGPQRYRAFFGCCVMTDAMLPRISGLPTALKERCGAAICRFVQSVSLAQVYAIKHTLPFEYLRTVKFIVQYNKRVHLDTEWVSTEIIDRALEDDAIQMSSASIRMLAAMERLLGREPKARETKAAVPVKVLYSQFSETAKRKGPTPKVRTKVLKALLAYRNNDATDEERATKRKRREELRVEDRLQRKVMREEQRQALTKEEREERRKHIMMAKQQRIAKNRDRKRRLHAARQKSFQRWRQEKLAMAASVLKEAE